LLAVSSGGELSSIILGNMKTTGKLVSLREWTRLSISYLEMTLLYGILMVLKDSGGN